MQHSARIQQRLRNRRGIALVVVILLILAVAAITLAAGMTSLNVSIVQRQSERAVVLENVAFAGLEEARSRLNGDAALYPDSAFVVIDDSVEVRDASGTVIPNVRRWVYAGPTGITSGQYGILGSIVAVTADNVGNRIVRRMEVKQESFARFAYFTDFEDPNTIRFGGGDQLFGPVHSNASIGIWSSGATFWNEVSTAQTIIDPQYGTFAEGYQQNVPQIPMPQVQELTALQAQATAGSTFITGDLLGSPGGATVRIEFIAIDLNGDGNTTDADEGFFRVYRGVDPAFVTARVPGGGMRASRNCGDFQGPHNGTFSPAAAHPTNGVHSYVASLNNVTRRCFLGGDPALTNGWQAVTADGQWLAWTGAVDPRLTALGRPDATFLFPLSRALNPNFKGVIYVNGNVALSGVLRGRVTVVSSGEISIVDDLTYATDPGAGTCADILGILSANDIVMSNNTINAPWRPATGNNYRTYDDTKDEFVHAILLALNQFRVDAHDTGPTNEEDCESTNWGRGCLYLTGGVIQRTRGAVGTGGGTGNLKRYSYDACAATDPPPYFPTTGHFIRNRIYDINPVGFGVNAFFAALTPGN